MTHIYKILENGKSCHGGNLHWSLPELVDGTWTPGAWHEVRGDIKICENGLHLTENPGEWLTWNGTIYLAQGEGDQDQENKKIAFRRARLLAQVPAPDWWKSAHHFVERAVPATQWLCPDGNPDPEWKLYLAPSLVAARDAARSAAWDAARDAAWDAARDAAWDAGLMASLLACDGLAIDNVHCQHIISRWRVWEKGYALLCDIDGVLYVYAAKP